MNRNGVEQTQIADAIVGNVLIVHPSTRDCIRTNGKKLLSSWRQVDIPAGRPSNHYPSAAGRGTITNAIDLAVRLNLNSATTENFDHFVDTFGLRVAPMLTNPNPDKT